MWSTIATRVVIALAEERVDVGVDVVDEVDGCDLHRPLDAGCGPNCGAGHGSIDVVGHDDLVARSQPYRLDGDIHAGRGVVHEDCVRCRHAEEARHVEAGCFEQFG